MGPASPGVGDYGRPLNPHNREHVTGGSSSGSGAAVAGGMVDIALGGDQGGSIRLPAAWCGIVGLMPTHGLVSHTGVFGLEPTIDYVGPMARRWRTWRCRSPAWPGATASIRGRPTCPRASPTTPARSRAA